MPAYQEPSPWTPIRVQQSIDPILLGDRRLSIRLEMQERSLAAKNAAKSAAKWADAEAKLADEWAEKLFAAWIETWDEQGLPRCHALYRVVYDWELIQHFAGRNSYFQGESQRLELLKRQPNFYSGTRQWFARKMRELSRNWDRRMNVESRKCMYAARRDEATASPAARIATPAPAIPLESTVPPPVEQAATNRAEELNTHFEPSPDYLLIRNRGREYKLTPHAAKVAKALHEAAMKNHGLTSAQIKRINGGGRFWDAFRSQDGEAFREDLIEKTGQGYYRLKI
jgi:hypothetical protein